MTVNLPENTTLLILTFLSLIIFSAVIAGTVATLRPKNKSGYGKKKAVIISILCIFVVAVSWITTMGWMRFFLTFILIPFLHAVYFFVVNLCVSFFVAKYRHIRLLNLFFCITYMLSNIFFPDGGDTGELYFFFGLVKSDFLSGIAYYISFASFLAHIVLFILQIVQIAKMKQQEIKLKHATPSWDEIVKVMYDKSLDAFTDEVIQVIYSRDKSMRYILLKNTNGLFTYHLESIFQFDKEELKYASVNTSLPATWISVNESGISLFATEEDAIQQIIAEDMYKRYF